MDLGEPIVLPSIDLPEVLRLPVPGVKGSTEKESTKKPPAKPPAPPEVQNLQVPFTDVTVPMPTNEIMVAAGTTAVISVAATLTATSVFKWIVTISKPVLKQMWNRLTKKKAKQDSSSS